MRPLTSVFGLLFTAAAALAWAAGVRVTASLFIADRSPQSAAFLGVSPGVSAGSLALGLLLVGVVLQVVAIARMAAAAENAIAAKLAIRVRRLLMLLVSAALGLCGLLVIVTLAILARVDQGFAVFG
jgi:hypothetical protein